MPGSVGRQGGDPSAPSRSAMTDQRVDTHDPPNVLCYRVVSPVRVYAGVRAWAWSRRDLGCRPGTGRSRPRRRLVAVGVPADAVAAGQRRGLVQGGRRPARDLLGVEVPSPRSGFPGALVSPVAASSSQAAAVSSGGLSLPAASASAARLHAAWSQAWMVACRSRSAMFAIGFPALHSFRNNDAVGLGGGQGRFSGVSASCGSCVVMPGRCAARGSCAAHPPGRPGFRTPSRRVAVARARAAAAGRAGRGGPSVRRSSRRRCGRC